MDLSNLYIHVWRDFFFFIEIARVLFSEELKVEEVRIASVSHEVYYCTFSLNLSTVSLTGFLHVGTAAVMKEHSA